MISIALDGMGGDHAPRVIVDGAVAAARHLDVRLVLVGPAALLEAALDAHRDWRALRLEIVDAPRRVGPGDPPPAPPPPKPPPPIPRAAPLGARPPGAARLPPGHTRP